MRLVKMNQEIPKYKLSQGNGKCSRARNHGIIEQEIPGTRQEIPKEIYKYYGDAAMNVEIRSLRDHGEYARVLSKGVPKDGVCINGRCAYTTEHKPLKAGHTKRKHMQMAEEGQMRVFAQKVPNEMWGKCLCANSTITDLKSAPVSNCIQKMEFRSDGWAESVFKVETIRCQEISRHRFIRGGNPEERWQPLNPIWDDSGA